MSTLPWSRPLTRADLAAMPDDGHRHELLDGTLIVSPSPSWLHQTVVRRLARLLDDARPSQLRVFVAPLDVVLADDTVLQPDVLVARRTDLSDRDLAAAPVLAVEVVSPSTRRIDQLLKPARYAAAGVAHYWVVDPGTPSLRAFELTADLSFREVVTVRGAEAYETMQPFSVTVVPRELVADI